MGDTAQEYIDNVLQLAKSCQFKDFEEELVRNRLVVGIRNHRPSEQLQLDENLTLQKTLEKIYVRPKW